MLARVIINTIFGLCVSLVVANVVNAATLGVSPVRVTLSDTQKMDTITVRNDGPEPASMQSEMLNWSQEYGEDAIHPPR